MNLERQRRYIARVYGDPHRKAEFLMKDRLRKQNKFGKRREMRNGENECDSVYVEEAKPLCCMLALRHPFTGVVAGPTGSGKTAWVLRVIGNAREMIEPEPNRIWYYYGEYQSVFNNYPSVHFEEGLPQLSHEVFDGCEPSLVVIDDHMSEINQLVADIFTKISHHRNVSVLLLTQNLFDKNKFSRTISLNSHYLVLFKNPRDVGQFAVLARQMYPHNWKFATEAYQDATSVPYGYLLVDLKSDQDERFRLRTSIFPGETQYVYVNK